MSSALSCFVSAGQSARDLCLVAPDLEQYEVRLLLFFKAVVPLAE
eukprot:CAMPEP_0206617396 /NCGR_PEP_ID=MMETSP0325_2-20121206/59580_1 /ASSEMBLY_ACC=CAM_ASM_000347 /TAXON_ID=2866 /ORGANISM="Crypthecodinium cohnii, Strain Seligo" /LENGTH=44 /DNA_ID= /DNA_START= /DNA_END= /DNA_ORIENTATION=